MLSAHYTEYFRHCGDELHVAAHSHHPWPDVARAAHLQYWEDSARLTNRKWAKVFGEVVPTAQRHVARLLNLDDPELVAFAPNTHEFTVRLLFCLDWSRPQHLVTTDSEFRSFGRQAKRLEETGQLRITRVSVKPFETFSGRFIAALSLPHDMVWLSQVFFDTGFVVQDLERIVASCAADALVAIDGYHAFCALPVDLAAIRKRAFYLAGGYKYAQSGEGCCFLTIPAGCDRRPLSTGWFSEFGGLSGDDCVGVRYGEKAFRFWGSTFDASGLYRFNAMMQWLDEQGATPREIHAHAVSLQQDFLAALATRELPLLPAGALTPGSALPRGNFCAFEPEHPEEVERRLARHRVIVDRRGPRVRFGFGVYHDRSFPGRLIERVEQALTS
jgi:kynureninase